MKDTITCLRELAKSSKYQSIYSNEKQIGLRLFNNLSDYTDIQINFLDYLMFYYNLNVDIVMGEVGEIVLDNFIYEDAYAMYKQKKRKQDLEDTKKEKKEVVKKPGAKPERLVKTQFVFRKPKSLAS